MGTGQGMPARVTARQGARPPDVAAHALRALRRLCIRLDEERFAEAHVLGSCYLCKIPYHESLPGSPCAHWLVMPASARRPIGAMLDTCGIATVLCFLLCYIRAGQSRGRLAGKVSPCGGALYLTFDRRVLALAAEVAESGASVSLRRATRGCADMLAAIACPASDARLLAELARIVSTRAVPNGPVSRAPARRFEERSLPVSAHNHKDGEHEKTRNTAATPAANDHLAGRDGPAGIDAGRRPGRPGRPRRGKFRPG